MINKLQKTSDTISFSLIESCDRLPSRGKACVMGSIDLVTVGGGTKPNDTSEMRSESKNE